MIVEVATQLNHRRNEFPGEREKSAWRSVGDPEPS